MPPELDNMNANPAMDAPTDMPAEPMGDQGTMPDGEVDREGAMARADLYKMANYSLKLFKKIQDDDQLESWVQAKITKAADYVASVYHYLEYEMKFSEYGKALDNSDVMHESTRQVLKARLDEAKEKMKALKIKQADKLNAEKKKKEEKVKEGFEAGTKPGTERKTATGVHTKTATGSVHKNTSYADGADDDVAQRSGKGKKSHAKSMSADEKKSQAPKLKQSPKSAKTWGMKDNEKFDNRDKVAEAKGKKPDFLDMDKDGDKKEPMKKAVADKKKNPFAKKVDENKKEKEPEGTYSSKRQETDGQRVARLAKEKRQAQNKERMKNDFNAEMEREGIEEGKPSAGLSKAEKSKTVKDAKAGKDIGKPGKSFDKVAKAAGGGEKGTKIAAAAMWKNKAKANVKEAIARAKAIAEGKPDFLDLDKDGDKKEPMKKAATEKKVKEAQSSVYPSRNAGTPAADAAAKAKADGTDKPGTANPAMPSRNVVKESADMTRMKELMTRLNG